MSNRDFNANVIAEFRANGGKVGGPFAERDLLLLQSVGAKSGQVRTTPLVYGRDGDRLIIIASKGGSDQHPDWYFNLLANPEVTIEVGSEMWTAQAIEVREEPERSRLYAIMVERMPFFAEYAKKARRVIPVFVLVRVT
jgi:deazaflavin-dependent oxidoreductase (nitroreductase family)